MCESLHHNGQISLCISQEIALHTNTAEVDVGLCLSLVVQEGWVWVCVCVRVWRGMDSDFNDHF